MNVSRAFWKLSRKEKNNTVYITFSLRKEKVPEGEKHSDSEL